jgi:hypothetical protein
MNDLKQFIGALLSHWIALMGGGAIIVVFGIVERATGRSVSWSVYIPLLCALIVIASFLAWRDKQRELAAKHLEVIGLQQELANERDPIRREFEAIRLRLLTTTLETEITQELGNLKTLILSRRELLSRKDVGDFFIKWINPHEIHLQVGAQLGLSQTQYDEMRQDLANIGAKPSKEIKTD